MRAYRDPLQRGLLARGEQRAQGRGEFAVHLRDDGQVEQAVVEQGVRAQRLAAAGLAPVAQAERNELAFPGELRPFEARLDRIDLAQLAHPGDQVGQAAEHLLQPLVGVHRDLGAEAAAGDVGAPVRPMLGFDAQQVDGHRRRLRDQFQRRQRGVGNAGSGGEIVGRAQRHQAQRRQRRGIGVMVRERAGDFAQGAVATGGDDAVGAVGDRLGHVALGIALLPGHPHLQLDAARAQRGHGGAQWLVARRLAIEDQTPVRCCHADLPEIRPAA